MIAFVIGTKAELIKCAPVMLELQKNKTPYFFVHTGQHPLGKSCEEFGIKKPDYFLSEETKEGKQLGSKAGISSWLWFLKIIFKVRGLLRNINPDYVIYHGDTISTGAAAIGSSSILNPFKKWKNVHLEAGLRSGSFLEPFPEEIVRQTADRFSDILLAVSQLSAKNLKRERATGVFGKIFIVGNTVLDSAEITYSKVKKQDNQKKQSKEEYALINMHRHENLGSLDRMQKIIEIIKSINIRSIWPMHEVTKEAFESYGLMRELKKIKKLEITAPVSHKEFILLLINSKYLIVDGGSIQEESLIFKKPCILLRKTTERPEGLSTGINFLTKLNVAYTKKVMRDIEENRIKVKDFKNPYGEVGVSKKILELLK
ncbi:MAG: UDP-N-acetylglucosamine 2-epimerase (non-hydrolyzing) [Candidatus Pacearchaeota archaeon]|nr:UDP-N-acetylglucosamine 2-epimerase (non-hydrolyzing) [Candidatus Pacearchaeota archaeon]